MANDDKLWNNYASWGIEDAESPISCFLFYIWVLFVVLQISIFNVYFSMEWLGWTSFNDGAHSLLLCVYEECESQLLAMVGVNASRQWEDGVKEKLYEARLVWKNKGICEKELSFISKLWCCYVCCVEIVNRWGWMPFYGSLVFWFEACFPLCHELQ